MIKEWLAKLKLSVDVVKTLMAIGKLLVFIAPTIGAGITYADNMDKEGQIESATHAVKTMSAFIAAKHQPAIQRKAQVINNCGTICAKLVYEHAHGRKH